MYRLHEQCAYVHSEVTCVNVRSWALAQYLRLLPELTPWLVHLIQVVRSQLEEKRPLVEHSLETGRLYLREEGLDEKRHSTTDSGEGMYTG